MMQPIILAAGKGTRMGSELPKTLFPVYGKPMLSHILESITKAGNTLPPIIVVGHKGEAVKDFLQNSLVTVEQTDLSGTATAVKTALPVVPPTAERVFIMYGDHPFIKAESIRAIEQTHMSTGATLTLGTATLPDFSDWRSVFISFGRIVRNLDGEFQEIKEYKNANEYEQKIREVNPGFYCVDRAWLEDALTRVERNEVTGEYYLTDIAALALYDGKKIETIPLSPEEAIGINSQEDIRQAENLGFTQ